MLRDESISTQGFSEAHRRSLIERFQQQVLPLLQFIYPASKSFVCRMRTTCSPDGTPIRTLINVWRGERWGLNIELYFEDPAQIRLIVQWRTRLEQAMMWVCPIIGCLSALFFTLQRTDEPGMASKRGIIVIGSIGVFAMILSAIVLLPLARSMCGIRKKGQEFELDHVVSSMRNLFEKDGQVIR